MRNLTARNAPAYPQRAANFGILAGQATIGLLTHGAHDALAQIRFEAAAEPSANAVRSGSRADAVPPLLRAQFRVVSPFVEVSGVRRRCAITSVRRGRSRALAAPAPRSESGTGCAGMTDAAPRHSLVLGLVIGRRGHSMAASGSYPRFFDLSRPDRAFVRVLVVPAKARNLDPRAMGRRLPRQSPSPGPASALRTIRPPVGVPGKAP